MFFFASLIGLFILIPSKTFTHFKYQRLKRGEKSRGLLNIVSFSRFIIKDYFVTTFLFPAIGKNDNIELEKMRRGINLMVIGIYTCFLLLIISIELWEK